MIIRPAPPESGGWIKRMLPFMRAHRRDVTIAFGAALVGMTIAAFMPLLQKIIIDDAILHDRRSLTPWLALLTLSGAARFGLGYLRRYFGGRVALDVQYDLRNTIFDQLQRLDFARHDEMQTGQLVSRASSDVGLIQAMLALVPITLGNALMFAVSVVLMLLLSVPLTLLALIVIPTILAVAVRMRTTVFPSSWDAQQRAAEVAGVVDEAVTGVRVVKGFGQEQHELDRLVDTATDLYASRVRAVHVQARFIAGLQTVPAVGQVAIFAAGSWLALNGHITIGTFVAFSAYVAQMVAPVRMLAVGLTVAQQARAGAERILDLLDSNPLVVERPGATMMTTVNGDVAFDDVTFGYLRSEPVLCNVSLHIAAGETVAFVGASGSGKSTTALLLPRFYDVQSGAVRIDGIDVRDVTLHSLRRQIGVVFEESFLFSDTISANIAYGHPDATRAEIEAAARATEADTFVDALPDGYETVVGERGLTLSGGQRQRIALARALLTDPRILVLDDATSAVDARIEEEIHATLRRLMRGRTTLLIAHRRSTLRLADRIVVLDRGRVVDDGSHEELLARCPLYRQLLSGPGDGIEELESTEVAIEAEAVAVAVTTAGPRARVAIDPPIGGGGMGGGAIVAGGGMMGAMGNLPATPELLAALDKLPPANDRPNVDVAAESHNDGQFTLRRFTGPYARPLVIGMVLVAADALMTLAGPYLYRRGIDDGVRHAHTSTIWSLGVIFLLITLADWWTMWAETRYTGRTAERLLFALRVRIFAQLQRLGIDFYEREMAGRIMTRMTSDVEALSQLLQNGLVGAIVNLVTFAGVAIAMFVMNRQLALATMAIVPPLAVVTIVFRRLSDRAYGAARERIAAVNANLQENLAGVRVTQAFVREQQNATDFRAVNAKHLDARVRAQRLQSIYFPFVEFLSVAATALVLGVGAHLIHTGTLSPGELIAFLLYLTLFFSPIQQLSQVFDTYQQAGAAMDKIRELLATETSTPNAAAPVIPEQVRGNIAFDNVWFSYTGAIDPAIAGMTFTIPAGQTVALVGETGAGKSTVVKLLARFYDVSSGRVLVDGVDVRDLDLAAFRHSLGYVPQEAFLFSGTIRDNIAYGRPQASDAEIRAAARAVGADDFIAALPGRYHHPVTERGRSLSSGQRQLIALARARLVDPAILLLDEATSNLDLGTEARVNRAMGIVAAGRTSILIAHRLQTARAADRILVVAAGLIVEDGTHDTLLAAGGRYATMWEAFSLDAPAA